MHYPTALPLNLQLLQQLYLNLTREDFPPEAGMQEGTLWSMILDFMGSNNHPVSVHTMEYHQDYLVVELHCF